MKVTHWPLFQLRLRTPRLELRLPTLHELDELAELSTQGIHDPDEMPFAVPWTDLPPAERARGLMQFHWGVRANWTPENWDLQLGVFQDGRILGVQAIVAKDFAIVREVATGSWLGRRYQGQGLGTEMRAAVLELAFTGLGAESAVSAAMIDNRASEAISKKLGYRPDGFDRARVRDALVHLRRFRLDRDDWKRHRRLPVEIHDLEPCLPLFGL